MQPRLGDGAPGTLFHRLTRLDWPMIGAALVLSGVGVICVAAARRPHGDAQDFAVRQAVWWGMGLVLMLAVALADYRGLYPRYRALYVLMLLGLGLVLALGHSLKGAQRWIAIGPFTLQPSEFAKILMVIALAAVLVRARSAGCERPPILATVALTALPMILILRQPDLGTALVLLALWFSLMYLGGTKPRALGVALLMMLLAFGVAWQADLIRDYQKERLIAFLDPGVDPSGAGYQLRQSTIAVGSGGVSGTPPHLARQSELGFVPAQHTDFVFTVVGERAGFLGCALVMGAFMLLALRAGRIMLSAEDKFGALLVGGICAQLMFQVLVNVGMTVGLAPITGIPLPFMSYGGSSMLTSYIGLGLMLSVGLRVRREGP